jgi:FKBP-type peptidyl-prolyl cis-trans isomerase
VRRLAAIGLSLLLGACGYSDPTPSNGPAATVEQTTPTPLAGLDDFSQGANQAGVKLPDGLRFVDLVVGTGDVVLSGAKIQVHYTGWLSTGSKFDSSRDSGQPFDVQIGAQQVIPGWDEGIPGMKVGGKRRLTIPPALGYGATPPSPSPIPPNATLVFDVELLKITAPPPSPSPGASASPSPTASP